VCAKARTLDQNIAHLALLLLLHPQSYNPSL
jgi:hypothetical protein